MGTVNGGIVGFFSLEMSAEQLATRIISEQTGIPSNKIRRGDIDEGDFERIKDVSIELQNLPFYVDETGGLSIGQLAARARRLKRQRGLDLLVIDYIQLLQGNEPPRQRKSRAGNHRDHDPAQGARQGAQHSDPGAFAIIATGGTTAMTSGRNSPICANRDRSNRTPTWCYLCSVKNIILKTKSLVRGLQNLQIGKRKWTDAHGKG